MTITEAEVAVKLEGIINRLEDLISEGSIIHDPDDVDYDSDELAMDPDIADETGGVDSALLIMERQLNDIIQVVGEEVDNLRRILERMEDFR